MTVLLGEQDWGLFYCCPKFANDLLVFWVPASFLVLFPKKTLVWKSGTNTAADSFLDGALHFLLRKLRLQLSTESGYDFLHIGAQSYSGPLCLSWFDDVEMWLFVRCQDLLKDLSLDSPQEPVRNGGSGRCRVPWPG